MDRLMSWTLRGFAAPSTRLPHSLLSEKSSPVGFHGYCVQISRAVQHITAGMFKASGICDPTPYLLCSTADVSQVRCGVRAQGSCGYLRVYTAGRELTHSLPKSSRSCVGEP